MCSAIVLDVPFAFVAAGIGTDDDDVEDDRFADANVELDVVDDDEGGVGHCAVDAASVPKITNNRCS